MSEFVNFNIGKKLKEKGFILDYNLYGYKPIYTDVNTIALIWNNGAYEKDYFGENIPCPSISQVLKWLREQDIMVEIIPSLVDDGTWTFSFRIQTKKFYDRSTKDYDSYESSALACIEYILNDLI